MFICRLTQVQTRCASEQGQLDSWSMHLHTHTPDFVKFYSSQLWELLQQGWQKLGRNVFKAVVPPPPDFGKSSRCRAHDNCNARSGKGHLNKSATRTRSMKIFTALCETGGTKMNALCTQRWHEKAAERCWKCQEVAASITVLACHLYSMGPPISYPCPTHHKFMSQRGIARILQFVLKLQTNKPVSTCVCRKYVIERLGCSLLQTLCQVKG